MIRKIIAGILVVIAFLVILFAAFMPSAARGATIVFVTSNFSNGTWYFQTNTLNTGGNPGPSGTTITFVTSNYSNGSVQLQTNNITTPTTQVPFYPVNGGYVYGMADGSIGFYGNSPATQQVNSVIVTNLGTLTSVGALANAVIMLQSNLGPHGVGLQNP